MKNDSLPECDVRDCAPLVLPHDQSDDGSAKPDAPAQEITIKPQRQYFASIFPGDECPIPNEFAEAVLNIEKILDMPVWVLVQPTHKAPENELDLISELLVNEFYLAQEELKHAQHIALLVHSFGGQAQAAYQLASLLRRRCGGFTAVIPRYAKSAATLMVLGADQILLGTLGELGPLDAQVFDLEREQSSSALDEVQALERLLAFAMEAFDKLMFFLRGKSKKKVSSLLPHVLGFTSDFMRPLLDKIDTVHYTGMSRTLKVGEEYAIRLLKRRYGKERAEKLARFLVEKYPAHDFVIDVEETNDIGLEFGIPALAESPNSKIQDNLDSLMPFLGESTFVGRVKEEKANE